MVDQPVEVVPSRVIRVTLEVIGDKNGTRMTVYGAYMPNRHGGNDDMVEAAWQALEEDAIGRANVWVMGDLNAERPEVCAARRTPSGARSGVTLADRRLEQLLHIANLHYQGTGEPTHYKGGEIDHVLVNMRQAASTSRTRSAPGVCGRDHRLVWVEHHYAIDAEGCGDQRVVGPKLDGIKPKEWERMTKHMVTWAAETLGSAAYLALHVHDRARCIQKEIMEVASRIAEDGRQHGQGGADQQDEEDARWDGPADCVRARPAPSEPEATRMPAQRILHLFSGPPGRKDGLAAYALTQGVETDEIDILVHARRGDILRSASACIRSAQSHGRARQYECDGGSHAKPLGGGSGPSGGRCGVGRRADL